MVSLATNALPRASISGPTRPWRTMSNQRCCSIASSTRRSCQMVSSSACPLAATSGRSASDVMMMGTVDVTSGAVGRARLISKTLNVTDVPAPAVFNAAT